MRSRARLTKRFRSRRGIITTEAVRRHGLTTHDIRHDLRIGQLRRLARGRYQLAGAPPDWEAGAWAALSGIEADVGGVSHRAAAAAWGLTGYRPARMEVLVPVGRGTRNPLALTHRSRNLDSRDFVTAPQGFRITTVARTLVDLASIETDTARFMSAFDDAICRGLTTVRQVEAVILRVVRGARRGRRLLDAALAQWPAHDAPQNFGEMQVVRLLIDAGLPAPVTQHEVRHPDGRLIARVDCAYPAHRLAIERDSQRWHGSRRAVDRDIRRELALQAAGWEVRRISKGEIDSGAANFLAAVKRVLRRPPAARAPAA